MPEPAAKILRRAQAKKRGGRADAFRPQAQECACGRNKNVVISLHVFSACGTEFGKTVAVPAILPRLPKGGQRFQRLRHSTLFKKAEISRIASSKCSGSFKNSWRLPSMRCMLTRFMPCFL